MGSLRELDLWFNQITKIDSSAFSDLVNLREVYLNYNNLTAFNAWMFEWLDGLEYIDISWNPDLLDIDYSYFENMESAPKIMDWRLTNINVKNYCSYDESSFSMHCGGVWIVSIEPWTFTNYSDLQRLDLSNNFIKSIARWVFSWLVNLQFLDLRWNPLESVDYSDFDDMEDKPTILDWMLTKYNVDELCKSGNFDGKNTLFCDWITNIAQWAFDDYTGVQMIWFFWWYLESLDVSLFEWLDNLEFLMIQDNSYPLDVSEIEEKWIIVFNWELNAKNVNYVCDIENGPVWKLINCKGRWITKIVSGAFLWLISTSIQAPATIIHLNNNGIGELEDWAFWWISSDIPTYIDLQSNELNSVNLKAFAGIDWWFNVWYYHYWDNTLEWWVNVGYLNGLEEWEEIDMMEYYGFDEYVELDLWSNNLGEIDEWVFNWLVNLEEISLNENTLSDLNEDVFKGLNKLSYISIGWNNLNCIPYWLFNSNIEFEWVDDLKVCGVLDYDTIRWMCELSEDMETLDCSNKWITYLDSAAFNYEALEWVKKVILSWNEIKYMEWHEFENLPSLEYVNLNSNPLYCYPNFNEWLEEWDEGWVNLELDEEVPMCKELNANNLYEICDVTLSKSYYYEWAENSYPSWVIFSEDSEDYIIDCSNRWITSIAEDTFKNINMEWESNYIYLNRNLIRELDGKIFENLGMYWSNNYLYLNDNKIDRLYAWQESMWNKMVDVSAFYWLYMQSNNWSNYIYLDNNELESINWWVFAWLQMFAPSNHIYLNHNKILDIKDWAFVGASMKFDYYCWIEPEPK